MCMAGSCMQHAAHMQRAVETDLRALLLQSKGTAQLQIGVWTYGKIILALHGGLLVAVCIVVTAATARQQPHRLLCHQVCSSSAAERADQPHANHNNHRLTSRAPVRPSITSPDELLLYSSGPHRPRTFPNNSCCPTAAAGVLLPLPEVLVAGAGAEFSTTCTYSPSMFWRSSELGVVVGPADDCCSCGCAGDRAVEEADMGRVVRGGGCLLAISIP